jgi:nifR3 family TIM-barrel protein
MDNRQLAQHPNYQLILSPMEGVTDLPFRRLIREFSHGCVPFFVSEFLSTGNSVFLTPVNLRAVRFDKEEEPFCMQLFGNNAEKLSSAALQVQGLGAAFVELNAGCPAKKIADKGSGAGLLKDLLNLANILRAIRASIKIPLFLKCRLGWDENSICINEVLEIAQDEGVEQLTIHGRTKEQGYKGLADWNIIGEIAARAKIPVIGNGDINSPESALERIKNYGVKGIAIGRAVLRNPWLFLQIAAALEGKEAVEITVPQVCDAIFRYEELLRADSLREGQILGKLKQLSSRLCEFFLPALPDFRLNILRTESCGEFLARFLRLKLHG